MSRRSTRHEHAENSQPDLPYDGLALLERDGDETMTVGRPREGSNGTGVAFEDIEPGSGLEIVDDGRAFVSADGEALRFVVEVDGGVAVGDGENESQL